MVPRILAKLLLPESGHVKELPPESGLLHEKELLHANGLLPQSQEQGQEQLHILVAVVVLAHCSLEELELLHRLEEEDAKALRMLGEEQQISPAWRRQGRQGSGRRDLAWWRIR